MKSRTAILIGMLSLPLVVQAQNIQGVSDIYYDSGNNSIWAGSQTWADYGTDYYYDIQNNISVNLDDGTWLGGSYGTGTTYAGSSVTVYNVQPGVTYTATGYHVAQVSYQAYQIYGYYCSYDCYYPYDAYGYNLISNTPSEPDPTFSVWVWAPPIIAGTVYAGQITLGPTQKKTTTPGPPSTVLTVSADAFIPFPWIYGPGYDACYDSTGNTRYLTYIGDNRGYGVGTFRAKSTATAYVTSGGFTWYPITGTTISFAEPSPRNPDGTYAPAAYDYIFNDCNLEQAAVYEQHTENMHGGSFVTGVNQMQVAFWGGASNPLVAFSPEISWDFTIDLVAVVPSNKLYTIRFTHDCFPAHEAFIGTQQIHGYTPTSSDPLSVGYCLGGFGQITGQHSDNIY